MANSLVSPCPPPNGTENPSASVDIYAAEVATPVNRAPFQGAVSRAGVWSVQVQLAPDLAPGAYRVQARCYTDSGLNSAFGPTYVAGRLDVRLREPGESTVAPRSGRPGDTVQVGSGSAPCTPPIGSSGPRVRVSLRDDSKATRAEAEGMVDARTGSWSLALQVPDLGAQTAEITAVCLARVGAPAPYARYGSTAFTVETVPDLTTTTTTTTTTVSPSTVPTTTLVPGATTSAPPTTSQARVPAASLPPTAVATAIVAEPTYTG